MFGAFRGSLAVALVGAGVALALCTRPVLCEKADPPVSVSRLVGQVPLGLLGKSLGSKVVVEGTLAQGLLLENALHVQKVEGRPLPDPVNLELPDGPKLKPATRYTFEGYETGAFAGEPEWLHPNVQQPFQYRPRFVVTATKEGDSR